MAVNNVYLVAGVLLLVSIVGAAEGGGHCGKTSVKQMVTKLMPCADAVQDKEAAVSPECCKEVKAMGKNPDCLCDILLSDQAKSAGIDLDTAMTIPKRCNFADRPVGYKCGNSILP